MNKKLIQFIKIGISLLIISLIFYKIGILNIFESIKEANHSLLLLSILVFSAMEIFSVLNYKILLNSINKKVSNYYLFKYLTLSYSLGKISPGKLGEFIIIYLLKRENINYGQALVISIFDKIITLFLLTIIAIIGSFIYLNNQITGILIFILISIFILFYFILQNKIRSIIKRYILKNFVQYFTGFYKTFNYILKNKKKQLVKNLLVTFIKWSVSFVAFLLLFKAYNLNVNIFHIMVINSIITIISLIPISFSGLGLQEGSGIYLYNLIAGVDIVTGAAVMVVFRLINYILALIYYLFNLDLIKDIKTKK